MAPTPTASFIILYFILIIYVWDTSSCRKIGNILDIILWYRNIAKIYFSTFRLFKRSQKELLRHETMMCVCVCGYVCLFKLASSYVILRIFKHFFKLYNDKILMQLSIFSSSNILRLWLSARISFHDYFRKRISPSFTFSLRDLQQFPDKYARFFNSVDFAWRTIRTIEQRGGYEPNE